MPLTIAGLGITAETRRPVTVPSEYDLTTPVLTSAGVGTTANVATETKQAQIEAERARRALENIQAQAREMGERALGTASPGTGVVTRAAPVADAAPAGPGGFAALGEAVAAAAGPEATASMIAQQERDQAERLRANGGMAGTGQWQPPVRTFQEDQYGSFWGNAPDVANQPYAGSGRNMPVFGQMITQANAGGVTAQGRSPTRGGSPGVSSAPPSGLAGAPAFVGPNAANAGIAAAASRAAGGVGGGAGMAAQLTPEQQQQQMSAMAVESAIMARQREQQGPLAQQLRTLGARAPAVRESGAVPLLGELGRMPFRSAELIMRARATRTRIPPSGASMFYRR